MSFKIGNNCRIHPNAVINVEHGSIGDRCIIEDEVIIEGTHVVIGSEAFIFRRAWIGGGSCFESESSLIAGDFLHMGLDSHINIARPVTIGHECGIGTNTKIYTHGAYESVLQGFPVDFDSVYIGNNVWLPNAWVNPGVTIGNNVVVAACSLVNKDLPSGCLAGGVPAKILKENVYPKILSFEEIDSKLAEILSQSGKYSGVLYTIRHGIISIVQGNEKTIFDTNNKTILGFATDFSVRIKDLLRRYGIRFRYYVENGRYTAW